MIQKRSYFIISCLLINMWANCAASSSQQSVPTPTILPCATLKKLALKALIAHPAQLAKDLPALHNESNSLYDQRYTLPAESISDALVARLAYDTKQPDVKKDTLSGLAFSPDGRTIATWRHRNSSLKLTDLATGKLVRTLNHGNENVYSAAFRPDGIILTTGLRNKNIENANLTGTARLWNPHTGKLLHALPSDGHPTTYFLATAFNADGSLIALASSNDIISIWNPATGENVPFAYGSVKALAFSPDNALLATESTDGNVVLWNALTGERKRILRGDAGTFLSLTFSSDGNKLSAVTSYGAIKVWDILTGILEFNLERIPNYRRVIISRDGHQAGSMQGNTISLWNTQTSELLHTMNGHTGTVVSLAFSPDRKLLASGSHDRTVRLWSTETGTLLQTFLSNEFPIDKLVFTPDGTILVAYSTISFKGYKSYIQLWRLDYQKDLQTISDINEQQFLLHAAHDWLAGNPHKVSKATYPVYQNLISRFPYLHDDCLFDISDTRKKFTKWFRGKK